MMKIRNKLGFTFIEVMIAIGVFSVGILVVLQMIIKNLTVVDTVKLRSSATILAKEGIEIVFNIRDANLDKGLNWNCLLDNKLYITTQNKLGNSSKICNKTFASGTTNGEIIQVSFSPNQYIYSNWVKLDEDFNKNFENNILYEYTGNVGDHILSFYSNEELEDWNNTTNKKFSRYVVFKKIKENEKIIPNDKLLKIESHVLIRKGGYTGEVILESIIGNY